MSDSQGLVIVERKGAIATITVNRPEKLNALNSQVIGELIRKFHELLVPGEGQVPVRCAILTGVGEKAFIAGADIAEMSTMTTAQAKTFSDAAHLFCSLVETAPFPVIAAVNGYALGGGLEVALACDFIYASENAKLGQPEVNLGVIPGIGGTQRLARRVGVGRARELLYTGDMIDAQKALSIGLVNAVFPASELMAKTLATAEKIAQKGPLAIAQAKRVVLRGIDADIVSANELEAQAFAMLFGTADQKEGMRAFMEKRKAEFRGE